MKRTKTLDTYFCDLCEAAQKEQPDYFLLTNPTQTHICRGCRLLIERLTTLLGMGAVVGERVSSRTLLSEV